jgi:DMSO/TMAO reductase YedYZ molybdopterin-dependent catalytic subunit
MNRLMIPTPPMSRRGLIAAGAAAFGGLMLAGCNRLATAPSALKILGAAEGLTKGSQRLLLSGQPLAREFKASDISPNFKVNGSASADSDEYTAMVANGFHDWKLSVDGLVHQPLSISLDQLKHLPARTQITRHDCVEGWSAIAQWTGPQLGPILAKAGLLPNARYVVFHCADDLEPSLDGSGRYYESIDLIDAFHPQTILAHTMNGQPLSVGHGAPIRLRVERQLGYKQAKYVMRIEVTDRLDKISGGKGGFWEDRGYEWYAGI